MAEAPILLDVSRLIWRQWTRRLPTGIDRVCLAYLEHFRSRARAVVQFRGIRRVLDRKGSDRLFELLLNRSGRFRTDLVMTLAASALRSEPSTDGQLYLNIGHTGLNSPHLQPWLSEHKLRPVFFIHDLIPLTHPQYCREGEAARHERRMEIALRAAKGMIVNSAATKLDLAHFAEDRGLQVPPCLVAWLGIDAAPTPVEPRPDAGERPYFVMIGTIEARKNHLLILEVWADLIARLGDRSPDLVVIGQPGWEADEAIGILDDPGALAPRLRLLSRCDDATMAQLVRGARAMLMPSFVEGFGLPLVESLQQGVPVIASDLPVFREIAGDIPMFLDPHDRQAWVEAVIDFSASGPEYRRQAQAAQEYRAPSWPRHFELVENFLETL